MILHLVSAVVLVGGATTAWAAAVTTVVCNDGNPQAVIRAPGAEPQAVDWITCDDSIDGVCHFTAERRGCLCPAKGCCGYDLYDVSVRHRRRLRRTTLTPRMRFECRRCPIEPASPFSSCPAPPPA
jgi:hypothetical protein